MSEVAIKALLDMLQRQMDGIAAETPTPPAHPILSLPAGVDGQHEWAQHVQTAFVEPRRALILRLEALDAERDRACEQHAAWQKALAAHKAAVASQESEWERVAAQYEAVRTTAALLAAHAPEAVPTAEAVVTADAEGGDEDEDERVDAGLPLTEQIFSVFTRNVESSKQWTTREVAQAYAKSIGLGHAVHPRLLKQVENTLRRLVKQGRLLSKKSAARGAVVHSLH